MDVLVLKILIMRYISNMHCCTHSEASCGIPAAVAPVSAATKLYGTSDSAIAFLEAAALKILERANG